MIGSTARCLTVAVPWNPLAWMKGSIGPRSVPVVGTSRTTRRTVEPTGYERFTTTSTRPFGTTVGSTRSPVGARVASGVSVQARTSVIAMRSARMPPRLPGAAAEEDLLQIR